MQRFYIIGFLTLLVFDTLAQISFKLAGADTHPSLDSAWIMRVITDKWTYGAVLGSRLAMQRPVHKFIALCPAYTLCSPLAKFICRMLNIAVLDKIVTLFIPYYVKQQIKGRPDLLDILDKSTAFTAFHIPVVPAQVMSIFNPTGKPLDLKKMQVEHYYLFTATQDELVDVRATRDALHKAKIEYKEFIVENSAHCLLYDYQRERVATDVVDILSE